MSELDHRRLTIRDTQAGDEVVVALPTGLDLLKWSPTGKQLILFREGNPYALYMVNVDGTGFRSLGDAQDVTWRPARWAVEPVVRGLLMAATAP